jgi:membrane-bound ClpP family serine protease
LASVVVFLSAAFPAIANEPGPGVDENPPAEPVAGAPARDLRNGRLVRVPLPLTGNVDVRIRRSLERAATELAGAKQRPALVLEFVPDPKQFGAGSNFGRAYDLAQFLAGPELSGFRTVAYLPRSVHGHGVLVALACEELIMAPDAELGDAGVDEPQQQPIDTTHRMAYRQIAAQRRTVPPEVALGMLDKDLEVLKVDTEVSTEYVLKQDLPALREKHNIQSETVLKRPGVLGRFTGDEGRQLGFVKYKAIDRLAVAKALGLPPTAMDEDPSLDGAWRPIVVALSGTINATQTARVQRTIEDKMRDEQVNFVCLRIESPGGSFNESITLANFLAGLDRSKVRTVAYIPREALADASLIATACDQLVMHKNALLGGPGADELNPEVLQLLEVTLRNNNLESKHRSWSLSMALVDPQLQVYRYTEVETGQSAVFSAAEAAEQPKPERWKRGPELNAPQEPLQLTGERAEQLGIAQRVVSDFAQFREHYGLEDELAVVEPNWADYLIDALASPAMAWILLLVGGAAFIAELHAPGIGLGGFVAGVCFLLYFWSRHLDGAAGWLEALLFLAGVACVLIEIFILPGTAVFGLGGGLLILVSLVLASQTFVLPRNTYQLQQLRDSLLGLSGVGVGLVVIALVMRQYLPSSPLMRHMMLEPPSGEELADLTARESLVDFSHLVGQQGLTVTQLTPSGKARFGHQVVDVIATGEVIERGVPVVVSEAYGNRVVVRTIDAASTGVG